MILASVLIGIFLSPLATGGKPPVPIVPPPGGEIEYAVNTWYEYTERPCADGAITEKAWIAIDGPVVAEATEIKACVVADSSAVVYAADERTNWIVSDSVASTAEMFRLFVPYEEAMRGQWIVLFEDGIERARLRLP